jgi:hypothetical protein
MAMIGGRGGWSEALAKGLKTYEGKPCPICGCTKRSTKNKACINAKKCYAERYKIYRSRYNKKLRINPQYKAIRTNSPEELWKKFNPDFRDENLHL